MIEKIIDYRELNENNCFLVPQGGFAYSKISEKAVATFFIFSCIGVYLRQENLQILAHIDCNPKRNLHEMLGYLYHNKIIKNKQFQKACLIKSSSTYESRFKESFDYLNSFAKKVDIIKYDYSPIHFAFDNSGKFSPVNVKKNYYSAEEALELICKRLERKNLFCENDKKEI